MRKATQIYVGIDISKETLDVALRPTDRTWQVANTQASIGELAEELRYLVPTWWSWRLLGALRPCW